MKNYLVTGANRGIGLEFVRQLLQGGDSVWATARQPSRSDDLIDLQNSYPQKLYLVELDLTSPESLGRLRSALGEIPQLDVLINNAGIYMRGETPDSLEMDEMLLTFKVNSIAPLLVVQELLPLLERSAAPQVINISSQMGSFSWGGGGGSYSYKASKAALNMLSRTLAADLRSKNISCLAVHPGWVRTDMGGASASLSAEEAVSQMLSAFADLKVSDTGKFINWRGEIHPW